MAFNKLEDTNALLLYRVGPVLMCSPTLQVESVIVPPAISRASAGSDAEPGMFKSMYGMVRVVDLRVRFGVEASQHRQPGQIIIVEVTGGHAGFWVDEIEDVIAFPQTGWSQVPSHVPGSVFSRALMQTGAIRLYAEFERLDGFKVSGYLREHILSLQQTAHKEEIPPVDNERSPAPTQSVQSHPASLHSASGHATAATPVDAPTKTHTQSNSRSGQVNSAISASNNSSVNSAVNSAEKPGETSVAMRNINSQHATGNQSLRSHKNSLEHRQSLSRQSTAGKVEQAPQKKDKQVKAWREADRAVVSNINSTEPCAVAMDQADGESIDGLQTRVSPTVSESEQMGAGWLWWFVPLLLLFVVLFILMQKQLVEDKLPVLKTRVDLQQDTVVFQTQKTLDNDVMQSAASINAAAVVERKPAVKMEDDLTDGVYIEPGTGDLIMTVNDYEENNSSESESSVEVSAQNQRPSQESEAEGQYEIEHKQPLAEDEIVNIEPAPGDKKQLASSTQGVKYETEKASSDEAEVADKTASKISRRFQHIVVKGDTLWSISGRYINKPWRYPEIARLSNIDDPNLIYPGQRVIIVLNYKKS